MVRVLDMFSATRSCQSSAYTLAHPQNYAYQQQGVYTGYESCNEASSNNYQQNMWYAMSTSGQSRQIFDDFITGGDQWRGSVAYSGQTYAPYLQRGSSADDFAITDGRSPDSVVAVSSDGLSESDSPTLQAGNLCRPQPARSPFEWMKKTSYQSQPNPGKTRTKDKYRVVYTDHQRLELEKEFHYSRYITIRRKSELATVLGLSERQVKIWFQNRRAKERKQAKKREELLQKNKDGSVVQGMTINAIATPTNLCHQMGGTLNVFKPLAHFDHEVGPRNLQMYQVSEGTLCK
ncbi:homeobox protein CDX-1-like [Uloborus diversus]|uniref:homeobox protein CDX-1-like n=1 Tax=Uloborus diversus TaxID=327109 RepID=UPI0024095218|nr:homeobox protein CDX-1-like [Uloborus diversus]